MRRVATPLLVHDEAGNALCGPVDRCRAIVADGLYNPFDAGMVQTVDQRKEEPRTDQRALPAPAGVLIAMGDVSTSHRDRVTAQAYIPPTYGPPNQ